MGILWPVFTGYFPGFSLPAPVFQYRGGVDISGMDIFYLLINFFNVVFDNKYLSRDIF